jgi:flavin-dependent dehydrogenase
VGDAVESYLREGCVGVREALEGAQRAGPWLAVGPLLSGVQRPAAGALFSVGNAAGETHPLVGEGIGMALQSATLLADELTRESPAMITARVALNVQRRYRIALHQAFSRRRRLAALYAHIAMRPHLARPARALFGRWPTLLTEAARLAGKARSSPTPLSLRFKHEHT